jgi:hypothetical protein
MLYLDSAKDALEYNIWTRLPDLLCVEGAVPFVPRAVELLTPTTRTISLQ